MNDNISITRRLTLTQLKRATFQMFRGDYKWLLYVPKIGNALSFDTTIAATVSDEDIKWVVAKYPMVYIIVEDTSAFNSIKIMHIEKYEKNQKEQL